MDSSWKFLIITDQKDKQYLGQLGKKTIRDCLIKTNKEIFFFFKIMHSLIMKLVVEDFVQAEVWKVLKNSKAKFWQNRCCCDIIQLPIWKVRGPIRER